jgi:small-conductance mechanosensitive channel
MKNSVYMASLVILLVVVILAVYFQFTTFGSDQYWVFVVILLVAYVGSRLLLRERKKG